MTRGETISLIFAAILIFLGLYGIHSERRPEKPVAPCHD